MVGMLSLMGNHANPDFPPSAGRALQAFLMGKATT